MQPLKSVKSDSWNHLCTLSQPPSSSRAVWTHPTASRVSKDHHHQKYYHHPSDIASSQITHSSSSSSPGTILQVVLSRSPSQGYASVDTRERESGPPEANPSTRTTGLPPKEGGPREAIWCDSTECALCCRNSTSWISGFPDRFGGEPLKYGGEQPKLEMSPQPPCITNLNINTTHNNPCGITS
jgi:hypothetical protein